MPCPCLNAPNQSPLPKKLPHAVPHPSHVKSTVSCVAWRRWSGPWAVHSFPLPLLSHRTNPTSPTPTPTGQPHNKRPSYHAAVHGRASFCSYPHASASAPPPSQDPPLRHVCLVLLRPHQHGAHPAPPHRQRHHQRARQRGKKQVGDGVSGWRGPSSTRDLTVSSSFIHSTHPLYLPTYKGDAAGGPRQLLPRPTLQRLAPIPRL